MESKRSQNRLTWCLVYFILLGTLSTGIYFLNKALNDPLTKEVNNLSYIINEWNQTEPSFKELQVSLSDVSLYRNKSQTWGVGIKQFPPYPILFYSGDLNLTSSGLEFKIVNDSFGKEYNITADLVLKIIDGNLIEHVSHVKSALIHSRKISNLSGKVCGNQQMGYWDGYFCYLDFSTSEFCFVVDMNYTLIERYEKGCDSLGYFKQQPVSHKTAEVYRDLTQNIHIEVRSAYDPFVYTSYNGETEFSSSSDEYKIIGGCLVSFSVVMLALSGSLNFCSKKKTYLNMDLNKI